MLTYVTYVHIHTMYIYVHTVQCVDCIYLYVCVVGTGSQGFGD